jgi:hypothetical protein
MRWRGEHYDAGSGGVGKSRLAVEYAEAAKMHWHPRNADVLRIAAPSNVEDVKVTSDAKPRDALPLQGPLDRDPAIIEELLLSQESNVEESRAHFSIVSRSA